jgi:hypothetical protein
MARGALRRAFVLGLSPLALGRMRRGALDRRGQARKRGVERRRGRGADAAVFLQDRDLLG